MGTCVRRIHQLKVLSIASINPLPVFRALGDRECLVDNVKVNAPKWVCAILVVGGCFDRTDDAML